VASPSSSSTASVCWPTSGGGSATSPHTTHGLSGLTHSGRRPQAPAARMLHQADSVVWIHRACASATRPADPSPDRRRRLPSRPTWRRHLRSGLQPIVASTARGYLNDLRTLPDYLTGPRHEWV
jgi:hypothetical protein